MTDAQVTAWLRCAGLSRFAPRFGAACVSQNNFLQLSSTDLDALGVDGPADRKRLHDLIADLRRSADLPPRRSTPTRSSTIHTLPTATSRQVLETLSHPNSSLSSNSVSTNLSLSKSATSRSTRRTSKVAPSSVASLPPSTVPALKEPMQSSRIMPAARVTVCVRKRPLSRKELTGNSNDIVVYNHAESSLYVHELKEKVDLTKYIETHPFTFDRVFGENVGNPGVYEGTARPLVEALFSGGRSTCFAYGQTGAGKTFTMAGDGLENPGLYTLAVRDLFDRIRRIERDQWRAAEADGDEDFVPPDPPQVWISFYEIYASKLQDLLNRSGKLECREDSNNEVQIVGLTQRLCEVEEDVLTCIDEGSAARATGVTGANDDSSRSHAVFQIELRHPPSLEDVRDVNTTMRESLLRGSRSPRNGVNKGAEIGRLCFIDLAGSERGIDTASSNRQTRMEGAEINKSLLALKECIRAMDQRKDHTPFRGSKLTQVLKASFMGKNCRTVMIANISPASCNVEHTLNTLRYSDRVKEIKRNGKQNGGFDSGKGFGGRRATFSHGVGFKPRQSTLLSVRSGSTQSSDDDAMDLSPPEPVVSERKPMKAAVDRPSTIEDTLLSSQNLSRGLPRRRTTNRLRPRPSDASALFPMTAPPPSDRPAVPKPQESRILRRRPSRGASQLPTRPSLGGSMLPKPSSKSKSSEDGKLSRTNSGLKRPSPPAPSMVSDFETMKDKNCDGNNRGEVQPSALKKTTDVRASGMITRRRAKELEAQAREASAVDTKPRRRSKSPGLRKPPTGTNAIKEGEAIATSTNYKASADIAVCKDELSDEDFLYDSSDDFVSAVTAAAEMSTICTQRDALCPEKMDADLCMQRRSSLAERNMRRLSSSSVAPRSFSYDGSPLRAFPAERQRPVSRNYSENLRSVIRLHHAQIEELMRLTEADVELVNAAEHGELDPQEYALKLSVNLSQKMDIVRTLQAKAKILE